MWSIFFFKKVVFPAGAHSCFYKYQSFEHLKMEVRMWSVVISGRLRISKRAEMNSDSPTSPLPTSQLTFGVWINSTASICASICSNSSHWFKKRRIRRIWVLRDVILSLSSSVSYNTTWLLTPRRPTSKQGCPCGCFQALVPDRTPPNIHSPSAGLP